MDWGTIIENTLQAGVGRNAAVYAIAAIGLNLHFGYTGLLNFGQVGFMAIGAYGTAISITYYGWHPVLAVLVGLLCAVVLALLLGLPALRLRADYLAIVTIATSEMVRLVARSASLREFSGGSSGVPDFASAFYRFNPFEPRGRYGFWYFEFFGRTLWIMVVGWSVVLLVTLLLWALMRSPWGRVVRAIREDEDAARALGKNAYWYKIQSLILGGVMGALAGMVLTIGQGTVQPDTFAPAVTFFLYTALILGGVGRVWTPIVGAMIFWMLLSFTDNFLRQGVDNDVIPNWLMTGVQVGQVRFILVGVGLMALMVFRPQGLFGNPQEMALDD